MNTYYKILNAINNYFSPDIDSIKYDANFDTDKLPFPDIFRTIDWQHLLESPPLNSSKQTLQELQELSDITKNIDDNDKKLIDIVDKDPITFFLPVLKDYGLEFPKKEFDSIYKPVYDLIMVIKYFYNRPRPYQLASKFDIKINVTTTKTHQTPSYPSGHTAYAELAKQLILYKYVDKVPFDRVDRIVRLTGEARMKQGIHYRSDIIAGQKLISMIFPHLINYYG